MSLFDLSGSTASLDPKLSSLFSSSVKIPSFLPSRKSTSSLSKSTPRSHDASSPSGKGPVADSPFPVADVVEDAEPEQQPVQKRRKRKRENEDLEGRHLQKLAREEAKETEQRRAERAAKKSKKASDPAVNGALDHEDDDEEDTEDSGEDIDAIMEDVPDDASDIEIPQHESLSETKGDPELEKASRTVFLANVSTAAMTSKSSKRQLLQHLRSIFPASENVDAQPKIESFRFRSTAYSNAIPKKAAFARKELMDATTKSTNAYVVYSTNQAAREAARQLNGTVVLGRHLRVDEVAHPAKIDHHRCVFVGNLGFVDDESQVDANAEREKKGKSQKGDVEEGLWQQFGKAGVVESVRVVRDPKTRVGKGFAYVQFKDENAVEAALLFHDKKFPPLLPRKLRVVRAKKVRRDGSTGTKSGGPPLKRPASSKGPDSASEQTLRGRVKKLLGRAGAAQMRTGSKGAARKPKTPGANGIKPPESFVFEGHRASSTQGNRGLKLGGKKKGGKPKTRSARRGAAWKTKGRTQE